MMIMGPVRGRVFWGVPRSLLLRRWGFAFATSVVIVEYIIVLYVLYRTYTNISIVGWEGGEGGNSIPRPPKSKNTISFHDSYSRHEN